MTAIVEFFQRLIRGRPNPHVIRKRAAKQTLEQTNEENNSARGEFLDQLKRLQRTLEGKKHGKHSPDE